MVFRDDAGRYRESAKRKIPKKCKTASLEPGNKRTGMMQSGSILTGWRRAGRGGKGGRGVRGPRVSREGGAGLFLFFSVSFSPF